MSIDSQRGGYVPVTQQLLDNLGIDLLLQKHGGIGVAIPMEIQALAGKTVAIQKMAITGAEATVCLHGHGACADENEALRCQHLQTLRQSLHIAHPFSQPIQHQLRRLNDAMGRAGLSGAQHIGHIHCFPVLIKSQLPCHGLRNGYASGPCRIEGEVYPDAAVEQAKQYVKQGYKAMKFKIGFGVNEDVKLIHAVREAIGPDIRIMVDANCAYDVSKAKRILFDTADADLYWFEEPISPENRTGYAELKNLTKTYLAAGEQEYSKYHYKEWLEARSVDILQPDLCVMGGFTEGKKVLALAQAYMIQLVPHMWGTGIGVAAGLQFIANIPATPLALFPDEPMIEYDLSENLLRDTLIGKTIKIENGTVKIPHGSGLGIKVDRNVIERFLMK